MAKPKTVLGCPRCKDHTELQIVQFKLSNTIQVRCSECGGVYRLDELVQKPMPPVRIREGIEV